MLGQELLGLEKAAMDLIEQLLVVGDVLFIYGAFVGGVDLLRESVDALALEEDILNVYLVDLLLDLLVLLVQARFLGFQSNCFPLCFSDLVRDGFLDLLHKIALPLVKLGLFSVDLSLFLLGSFLLRLDMVLDEHICLAAGFHRVQLIDELFSLDLHLQLDDLLL